MFDTGEKYKDMHMEIAIKRALLYGIGTTQMITSDDKRFYNNTPLPSTNIVTEKIICDGLLAPYYYIRSKL